MKNLKKSLGKNVITGEVYNNTHDLILTFVKSKGHLKINIPNK